MGIHIGDNNKIQESIFISGSDNKVPEKSSLLKTIWANVLSNLVWWVLGIIGIPILTLVAINT